MKKDKTVVLITGVSREEGIGFGLAKEMVSRGFEVIITARDFEKVKNLSQKINESNEGISAFQLDVTNDESVQKLNDFIEAKFGRLNVLINNAGGNLDYMIPPLETDFNNTKEAFETNLFGAWRVIKGI